MYLIIGKVIGHIEENNENKYLIFDFLDDNKEVLKKIQRTLGWNQNYNWNSVECKYGKYFTKTKFDIDDDLPLNKSLNLYMLKINVRFGFEGEGKFYPQVYLHECLYEFRV